MKLLSRMTGLLAVLFVTAVALSGTASAMLPPEPPDSRLRAVYDQPPTVVEVVSGSGLSTLQVVGLMALAAVAAVALTVLAMRLLPRVGLHFGSPRAAGASGR
jgi:hypothetical protein